MAFNVFTTIGISVVALFGIIIALLILRRIFCRTYSPWKPWIILISNRLLGSDAIVRDDFGTRINEQTDDLSYPHINRLNEKDEWEIDPLSLQITTDKLGSGAYAVVHRGVLKNTPPVVKVFPAIQLSYILSDTENAVAVKMCHSHSPIEDRRDFLQEIEFMKKLEYYPHVLSMLGCSTDPKYPILITELCEKGDLIHLLREMEAENKKPFLTRDDFIPIAWQMSDALTFLTSRQLIHRDVAARNVLITTTKMAKLCDFGLCRFNDQMFYTTRGGKLPVKWMAPESIEYAQFSTKTDVWSFGILLYEMFSIGQTPYNSVQPEEMIKYLKEGNRLKIPEETPEEIYSLITSTWVLNPSNRPEFPSIRSILYEMMEADSDSYGYLQVTKNYYRLLVEPNMNKAIPNDYIEQSEIVPFPIIVCIVVYMGDPVQLDSFSITFRLNGRRNRVKCENIARNEMKAVVVKSSATGNSEFQQIGQTKKRDNSYTADFIDMELIKSVLEKSGKDLPSDSEDSSHIPNWLQTRLQPPLKNSNRSTKRKPVVTSPTSKPQLTSKASDENNLSASSPGRNKFVGVVVVKARVMGRSSNGKQWQSRVTFEINNNVHIGSVATIALNSQKLDLTQGAYKFRLYRVDENYKNQEELPVNLEYSTLSEIYHDLSPSRSHRMIIDLTRQSINGKPKKGSKSWKAIVSHETTQRNNQ